MLLYHPIIFIFQTLGSLGYDALQNENTT